MYSSIANQSHGVGQNHRRYPLFVTREHSFLHWQITTDGNGRSSDSHLSLASVPCRTRLP